MIKYLIFFSVFIFPGYVFGQDIKGSWESDYCESYNDSISYGRFVYEFKEDNKVQTYIQFYKGRKCKIKTYRQKQAKGDFYLKRISSEKFVITVQYDHVETSYSFNVEFTSENKFRRTHRNHYHIYTKQIQDK